MEDAEVGAEAVGAEAAGAEASQPSTPQSRAPDVGPLALPARSEAQPPYARAAAVARLGSPFRRDGALNPRRSTPSLGGASTPLRSGSPHGGVIAAAQAARESTILATVRQQMEAMEERLTGQISRVQQQGNRTRDAALAQVDAKLGALEAQQPRLDRRLAELSGNFKGLSDEMQAQIRRADAMETRFWEAREKLEEELRAKLAELEQSFQQSASQLRIASATGDDALRRCSGRLRSFERIVDERLACADEALQRVSELEERVHEAVQEVQDLALLIPIQAPGAERACESALGLRDDAGAADRHELALVVSKVEDGSHRAARVETEVQEMQMRMEAQEERLRTIRTMLDRKEDAWRSSRLERAEWEGRSKELTGSVRELERGRAELAERVDLLQQKLQDHQQAAEDAEVRGAAQRETAQWQAAQASTAAGEEQGAGLDEEWAGVVQDCALRLGEAEARLGWAERRLIELGEERGESDLAPRVTALVDSLRSMTPKLLDQESCVQDLIQKVGQLEARADLAAENEAAFRSAGKAPEAEAGAASADLRHGGG